MIFDVPGTEPLVLKTIILDLNGTISVGGEIVPGVKERLQKLLQLGLKVVLLTGNTRGDADEICRELGIEWRLAKDSIGKKNISDELVPATCVSIGNGLIDKALTENVALGVGVLQAEGIHTKTMLACDLIVPTINDALDLFIDESRLIASLRS